MKNIIENIKKNFFIKLGFIIFVVQCIDTFISSIKLDSIDILISGVVNHAYYFLILYALGLLIEKKGSKNSEKNN